MNDAWTFDPQPPRPGWGVHAPPLTAQSVRHPIATLPLPDEVAMPLLQGHGGEVAPLVSTGDRVRTGQLIGRDRYGTGLHASITGTVIAIERRPVPAREPTTAACIILRREEPEEMADAHAATPDPFRLPAEALRSRIAEAGIVGLGGAVFPAAVKLGPGTHIDALLLNGAECEPWITCDEMLMRERPEAVVDGARIMMHALGAAHAVIAVEANTPEARIALRRAIEACGDERIGLAVVTVKYPAGGERQLIELVGGREVPSGKLPRDVGYVCQNVATAVAIADLLRKGRPLISRIVTVTGRGVAHPGNFEVRLGTPMSAVVAGAGGYRDSPTRLIMGGPMMGYALPADELPVTKATNCIVAATADELAPPRPEMPCIRCGECVQVCPARLLPQELNSAALCSDAERLHAFGVFDCIECGCCDYVCPSKIPLVERFIAAKRRLSGGT